MSYYIMPNNGLSAGYYQQLPVATPLWQEAPVPGWGVNPLRAGPPRVGVGAYATPVGCGSCGDDVPLNSAVLPKYAPIGADASSEQASYGTVALVAAGGIVLGLVFGWLYFSNKKMTPNWHSPKAEREALKRYNEYVREELSRGGDADIVSFEQFVFSGLGGGSDDEYSERVGGRKLGKRSRSRPVLGTRTSEKDYERVERAGHWEDYPWGW